MNPEPKNLLTKRDALVIRLRDDKKLTFEQIGARFDRSGCRAAQIYHAANHKIQFPPNGLSNRVNRLLTLSGFTVEKNAIALALRTGKLYPGFQPRNYGTKLHREICRWAGVDPATLAYPSRDYETSPDNGLSYRTNNFLKSVGIPATKESVLQSLKSGHLLPARRPLGYGKATHAELCLWLGITPTLFRKKATTTSKHSPPSAAQPPPQTILNGHQNGH